MDADRPKKLGGRVMGAPRYANELNKKGQKMKQRRKVQSKSAQAGVKQQERSQQKELPQQATTLQKKEITLWRWIGLLSPTGKIAAAIGLFLAFVGTYYAFSPKISVTPSELIETTNPYTTPFTIKNESLLPLRSIKTVWKFREIISENDKPINFNGPYHCCPIVSKAAPIAAKPLFSAV